MDFKPYVPANSKLPEFTFRAMFLGVIMAIVLGAANAYLGLKAGMTVAAAFPAAVVSMAALKLFKGSILEENLARTTASVGEALVAGAIFTLPAFYIAGCWQEFGTVQHYLEATAIMLVGGVLGVLFVTVLRKIMVEEASLPFPESVACAEIHKAGRTGGAGAKYLFGAMFLGGLVQLLAKMKIFAGSWEKFVEFGKTGINFTFDSKPVHIGGGGGFMLSSFAVSPALFGVGYIIGPRLACIAFSGGLLAWGLFVPLILFLHGPTVSEALASPEAWYGAAWSVWGKIVRPIAVGGMLGGAVYTLYKMRKQLFGGIARAIGDISKAAHQKTATSRIDKDVNFKWIFVASLIGLIGMIAVYNYFIGNILAAVIAAIIMIIAGFFFTAVSGYLVGLIGSSNNPISGLTLSTLIIASLVMLFLGVTGKAGVAGVLGVAAVVCCMCGVGGDMTQDLKVGHLLGGTPWKMEVGEIIGVVAAALVMFVPLYILHQGDIAAGGIGFGGKDLPAPQAGLMAMLAQGIVGGQMAWPLIIVGIFMTIGLILIQAPSPMLIAVGMYLPLETTFAIFIGGIIKYILDVIMRRRNFSDAKKMSTESRGILLSSGFIAGEALIGLLIASLYFGGIKIPQVFEHPSIWVGMAITALLAYILVSVPLKGSNE